MSCESKDHPTVTSLFQSMLVFPVIRLFLVYTTMSDQHAGSWELLATLRTDSSQRVIMYPHVHLQRLLPGECVITDVTSVFLVWPGVCHHVFCQVSIVLQHFITTVAWINLVN